MDIPYENQFSDPDAISSVSKARELLASAYKSLPHQEFELSVLSDDFKQTHIINKSPSNKNLYSWYPQSIRDLATSLWNDYYSTISSVNTLQERIKHISTSTNEERDELDNIISEAKTLKAYCYYSLLQLFAPAYESGADSDGIIIKDKVELQYLPRSSVKDCVNAIRSLLVEASTIENAPKRPYLLSQLAAYYLLADLELYAGNYGEAAKYALKVLDLRSAETMGGRFIQVFGAIVNVLSAYFLLIIQLLFTENIHTVIIMM